MDRMEGIKRTAIHLLYLAWHQKFIIISAVLLFVGVCIVITKTADDEIKVVPNYIDDYAIAKLDEEGKSRFNNENTSMFDPGLLEETRNKWIIVTYNASDGYNLEKPDVMDPSMGQAEAINELYGNMTNGFFIECGAFDGETRSNTLFFERYLNWTGLLIEADPINFEKLSQKNRRANLSNTCLSVKKYPIVGSFLMANNIGRLHSPHDEKLEDFQILENSADVAYHGTHVEVQCLPLATYIAALNVKKVDYLSLDIEGLEPEVLQTIPFDIVDIRTLSVEFNHNKNSLVDLTSMMNKKGYEVTGLIMHPDNLANDVIFIKKGYKNHLV